MKKLHLSSVITFILLFFSSIIANATHIAGGEITYKYLGNNGLQFRVIYTFYRDCAGVAAPGTVTIVTSSATAGSSFNTTANQVSGPVQVVPVCATATTTCNGGTTDGRQQFIYQADITLPSHNSDWVFSVSLSNRNNAITTINPTTVAMYVEATLNNIMFPFNNSSSFADMPGAFIYVNQPYCYNNGAVDIDGDSLVYTMITPMTGPGATVTYITPHSATQPVISNPPVTFNSATGDVCMTPTAIEVTVMAVRVDEYRYGTKIGSVIRDIQLTSLPGSDNLPTLDG
ncbi:MAG TPA: hypothetical protein VII99_13895, partial [Bacteroidia bacterium]